MAFGHGSRARLLANGYDLSPFMTDAGMAGTADVAEVSTWANADGSQRESKAYIPGLVDAGFTGSAVYDALAGVVPPEDAAAIFELALAGDVLLVYMPQGGAFGAPAKSIFAKGTGVDLTSPITDALKVSLSAQASDDIGHGVTLHDHTASETADGNSTTYDAGATGMPTANGGIGALEVNAKGGGAGTLTVKVQHSSDGSSWVDLITFTGTTIAHANQRVEVAGTVNRYLRALWTITGGTWQFHASFARFPTIV